MFCIAITLKGDHNTIVCETIAKFAHTNQIYVKDNMSSLAMPKIKSA